MSRRVPVRTSGSVLAAWLAAAIAATFLIFGGMGGAAAALSPVSSHVEAAEDVGAGEEITTSMRSDSRARARGSRRRAEPRRTVRRVAMFAARVPPLVVPTAFAPPRGPPLLAA